MFNLTDEDMKRYMAKRAELVKIEEKMHFSYDLKATFTEQEKEVNDILNKLRKQFKTDEYNHILHDFHHH